MPLIIQNCGGGRRCRGLGLWGRAGPPLAQEMPAGRAEGWEVGSRKLREPLGARPWSEPFFLRRPQCHCLKI